MLRAACVALAAAWGTTAWGATEDLTWSNTGSTASVAYAGQETWTFKIPATDEIPSGTLVDIDTIKIGSRNSAFNASSYDPTTLTLNGVTSEAISAFDGTLDANTSTSVGALVYNFSGLTVAVGTSYDLIPKNASGSTMNGGAEFVKNPSTATDGVVQMSKVISSGWVVVYEVTGRLNTSGSSTTVSEDCNWSKLSFNGTAWADVDKSKAISVVIASGVTVTLDTDVEVAGELMVSGSGTLAVNADHTLKATKGTVSSVVTLAADKTLTTGGALTLGETTATTISGVVVIADGSTTLLTKANGGLAAGSSVTVKSGATFVVGAGDMCLYGNDAYDVKVYVENGGTMDWNGKRWTMSTDETVIAYAGAVIKGNGDGNGAFDGSNYGTNCVLLSVSNTNGNGTVTCSSPLRVRTTGITAIDIDEGMLLKMSGDIVNYGSNRKFKLTGAGTMEFSGTYYNSTAMILDGVTLCLNGGEGVTNTVPAISSESTGSLNIASGIADVTSVPVAVTVDDGAAAIVVINDATTEYTCTNLTLAAGAVVKFVSGAGVELATVTGEEGGTVAPKYAPSGETTIDSLPETPKAMATVADDGSVTWTTISVDDDFKPEYDLAIGTADQTFAAITKRRSTNDGGSSNPYCGSFSMGDGDYTVSLYADLGKATIESNYVYGTVIGIGGKGNQSVILAIDGTNVKVLGMSSDNAAINATVAPSVAVAAGYHLYTITKSSLGVTFYVDGIKVGADSTQAYVPANGLQIGALLYGSAGSFGNAENVAVKYFRIDSGVYSADLIASQAAAYPAVASVAMTSATALSAATTHITVPVTGTIDIPAENALAIYDAHIGAAVTGAGVLKMSTVETDGGSNGESRTNAMATALRASTWTGTVLWDGLTLNQPYPWSYGNSGSSIWIDDCTGLFCNNFGGIESTMKFTGTTVLNNGWSGGRWGFKKLTGDGTIIMAAATATQQLKFGDVSEFTGSIVVSNSTRVAINAKEYTNVDSSVSNGMLKVAAETTAYIASTWYAVNGFLIDGGTVKPTTSTAKLDGTVTFQENDGAIPVIDLSTEDSLLTIGAESTGTVALSLGTRTVVKGMQVLAWSAPGDAEEDWSGPEGLTVKAPSGWKVTKTSEGAFLDAKSFVIRVR